MKLYLASRYSRRLELCDYRHLLIQNGHEVISRWLDDEHADLDSTHLEDRDLSLTLAEQNMRDIDQCDVFVLFTEYEAAPRATRMVEFGYAIGQFKSIATIGPVENMFVHLFTGWDTFQEFFESDWQAELESTDGA